MLAGAKLAGVLLERVQDSVIVGLGVNLAIAPPVEGRAVTALAEHGPAPDRDFFAERVAFHLARELERWRGFGLEPLIARWQAAGHPVGTPLTVQGPDGAALSGTFSGLTPEGALRLRLAEGAEHVIHAGDVSLVGG
jgi:BirA family biotin operon repressor/biotin-[acetyl-CoA-carboxylase] ligase